MLLEPGQLLGDVADQPPLSTYDGGRHGVRQLGGCAGREPAGLDALEHCPGLDERLVGVDDRVQRAVDGDQEVRADDLVELEEVDVAGPAEERGVHGDEVVVGVAVHGRHVVAVPARVEHERVATDALEEPVHLVVPHRYVDPDETVLALEQDHHVVALLRVRPRGVHEPHVHVPRVSLTQGRCR